jgi:Fur family transcriptional regulator, ferric uptake regulator
MAQRRSTWQKTAVKEQLALAKGFVSAQQLHQALLASEQKLGLTTVYRALTDMVLSEEADALTGSDGETRYRICGTEHHHHLICTSCGKTVEFELAGFEAATTELATQHGFSKVTHSIELFGICADCGVAG